VAWCPRAASARPRAWSPGYLPGAIAAVDPVHHGCRAGGRWTPCVANRTSRSRRAGNKKEVSTRLSWDRAGFGEPLLLLHGIGTTREDFSALRPVLEAEYDVLAVDLPGHGDSPSLLELPTIWAVTDAIEVDLDALGVGRVHVLGNSLGARIALELARHDRAFSVVSIARPASTSCPSGFIRAPR
jgi:pimeloyl-ACP methyl ester carboxylesterase